MHREVDITGGGGGATMLFVSVPFIFFTLLRRQATWLPVDYAAKQC